MGSGALGVSDRPHITTFDPSATAKTRRINTRTRTGHEHTDKLTDRDWDGSNAVAALQTHQVCSAEPLNPGRKGLLVAQHKKLQRRSANGGQLREMPLRRMRSKHPRPSS
jgi:hypothetical protein